jgi:hypothetical protein
MEIIISCMGRQVTSLVRILHRKHDICTAERDTNNAHALD